MTLNLSTASGESLHAEWFSDEAREFYPLEPVSGGSPEESFTFPPGIGEGAVWVFVGDEYNPGKSYKLRIGAPRCTF